MAGLIFVAVFLLFIILVSRSGTKSVRAFDRVSTKGVYARGLILSANAYSTGVSFGGRRFEKRSVVLDVEVPGQQPYVINVDLLIPRGLVRAVPGDALDLRVDPSNPTNIAVLGPGGFTGPWLRTLGYYAPNPWS